MKSIRWLCMGLILLMLSGCGAGRPEPETLQVSAAASLTEAFTDIGIHFEEVNPGVDVVFNFASSSTLRTQLLEGAPVDVFASANWEQMDLAVEGGGVAPDAVIIFATNRLAIVLPADNPARIASEEDLAQPGLRLVLAAPEVPAGAYALQSITLMGDRYGSAFVDAVNANIVSLEDSVRQVLTKVQLGEADAGIVYISDGFAAPDLILIPIPDVFNLVAEYPIAVTQGSVQAVLAQAFVDFVASPEGRAHLARWGFGAAP